MAIKTSILAASAMLFAASGANASLVTITRHGTIYANPQNTDLNPDHLTSLPGVALGDDINLTVTFDSSEIGPLVAEPNNPPDALLTNPTITGVALGSPNPANSVTWSVGSYTMTLDNWVCHVNPVQCEQDLGQDFHYGPTAIFKNGVFLGVDGGYGMGAPFFSDPVNYVGSNAPHFTQLVKSNLTDLSDFNLQYFGTDRSDLIWIFDPTFTDIVFAGHFDGPGISAAYVASVPEPASWAMLVGGFFMLGAVLRRRTPVALTA